MKKISIYSLVVLLAMLLISAGNNENQVSYVGDDAVKVTIFHNNDGESNLTSKDGYGNAASFVTLLRTLREEAEQAGNATLTLSSGDNFLAGTAFAASVQADIFYDAKVLSAIEYDAITLGNHDFDFGPDVLSKFIKSVDKKIPFLSSNLDFSEEKELFSLVELGRIAPSVVVESNGAHFGIIGATTLELASISSPRKVRIMNDLLTIVQNEVDTLTNQGINKIILVSHLQGIEEEKEFVTKLRNVDIVIAGGGDELLANSGDVLLPKDKDREPYDVYPIVVKDSEGREVPIVTTTGEYQYVGRLEVSFDADGYISTTPQGGLIRVATPESGQPDASVLDKTVMDQAVQPVERFESEIANNMFAKTHVKLDGTRQLIRSQETNFGNLVADALLWQARQLYKQSGVSKPDIALQNGGAIRNSVVISEGSSISELNTFTALPFPNFLVIVPKIEASQVKLIMENAVSQVENKKGRFAQISGFKIVYDASKQALVIDKDSNAIVQEGERIISLQLDDGQYLVKNGKVVDSAPSISIATINFLVQGGDQYPFNNAKYTALGVTYQQALANYLQASSADGGLDGKVNENDYPLKGQGRIISDK